MVEKTPQITDSRHITDADEVRTVALVSLGCPKNLVDSEKMFGLLAQDGLIPVSEDDDPDAIVINTCGFLEAAKDESLAEIDRAAALKRSGAVKRLIVAGCLVQRHRAKLLEGRPDIDALIGVFDRDRIVEAVRGRSGSPNPDIATDLPVYTSIAANAVLAKQHRSIQADGYFESDAARFRLTPRHYAYLRISEGCNQNCSFCTIPSIRGKMRSKPVDAVVAEMRELLADGAFEINLIGQDTTSYGEDIGDAPGLVGLLETLDLTAKQWGAQGAWLRLMYAYPSCFTDKMIDAIARLPNVLKYIDMPLQHINDEVLDRMKRRTRRTMIETLLAKLRERAPGIVIRTTLISGFPGETEAQHQELVEFVRDFGFEALGVFGYSPEPGTPAGTLHEQGKVVASEVVQLRIDELMSAQQQVAFTKNEAMAANGVEFDVLIDGQANTVGQQTTGVTNGGQLYIGRTCQQAPQIDSVTYVQSEQTHSPGELVRCRITAAREYDLVAQPLAELQRSKSLPVLS